VEFDPTIATAIPGLTAILATRMAFVLRGNLIIKIAVEVQDTDEQSGNAEVAAAYSR